ncbi:MAG: permease [Candidatus Methylomirabilales bacterium]
MSSFLGQWWFWSFELLKFMTLFYRVWGPGFLIAAFLSLRFRRRRWDWMLRDPASATWWEAVTAGAVGTPGRRRSLEAAEGLLARGISPGVALAYLIASRNMTVHFLAIYALSLGAEFAVGQVFGALVMIGVVMVGTRLLGLEVAARAHRRGLAPHDPSANRARDEWLLSQQGWARPILFFKEELRGFGPSLLMGIVVAGAIFAAGLHPAWPRFADVLGHGTVASDTVNALTAPLFSAALSLSPVGNLPVIHALFKTDSLSYAGIISFVLASAIHPRDLRFYVRCYGKGPGGCLILLLYCSAVLGGLGSTWLYGLVGFRPHLPPIQVGHRVWEWLLGLVST